ncbi:MAG: hypothetical protein NZT61_02020 [Deltaproteobacteria bacterium]|nr:hypothetical protein [Deltaproteobacteria bacterium]
MSSFGPENNPRLSKELNLNEPTLSELTDRRLIINRLLYLRYLMNYKLGQRMRIPPSLIEELRQFVEQKIEAWSHDDDIVRVTGYALASFGESIVKKVDKADSDLLEFFRVLDVYLDFTREKSREKILKNMARDLLFSLSPELPGPEKTLAIAYGLKVLRTHFPNVLITERDSIFALFDRVGKKLITIGQDIDPFVAVQLLKALRFYSLDTLTQSEHRIVVSLLDVITENIYTINEEKSYEIAGTFAMCFSNFYPLLKGETGRLILLKFLGLLTRWVENGEDFNPKDLSRVALAVSKMQLRSRDLDHNRKLARLFVALSRDFARNLNLCGEHEVSDLFRLLANVYFSQLRDEDREVVFETLEDLRINFNQPRFFSPRSVANICFGLRFVTIPQQTQRQRHIVFSMLKDVTNQIKNLGFSFDTRGLCQMISALKSFQTRFLSRDELDILFEFFDVMVAKVESSKTPFKSKDIGHLMVGLHGISLEPLSVEERLLVFRAFGAIFQKLKDYQESFTIFDITNVFYGLSMEVALMTKGERSLYFDFLEEIVDYFEKARGFLKESDIATILGSFRALSGVKLDNREKDIVVSLLRVANKRLVSSAVHGLTINLKNFKDIFVALSGLLSENQDQELIKAVVELVDALHSKFEIKPGTFEVFEYTVIFQSLKDIPFTKLQDEELSVFVKLAAKLVEELEKSSWQISCKDLGYILPGVGALELSIFTKTDHREIIVDLLHRLVNRVDPNQTNMEGSTFSHFLYGFKGINLDYVSSVSRQKIFDALRKALLWASQSDFDISSIDLAISAWGLRWINPEFLTDHEKAIVYSLIKVIADNLDFNDKNIDANVFQTTLFGLRQFKFEDCDQNTIEALVQVYEFLAHKFELVDFNTRPNFAAIAIYGLRGVNPEFLTEKQARTIHSFVEQLDQSIDNFLDKLSFDDLGLILHGLRGVVLDQKLFERSAISILTKVSIRLFEMGKLHGKSIHKLLFPLSQYDICRMSESVREKVFDLVVYIAESLDWVDEDLDPSVLYQSIMGLRAFKQTAFSEYEAGVVENLLDNLDRLVCRSTKTFTLHQIADLSNALQSWRCDRTRHAVCRILASIQQKSENSGENHFEDYLAQENLSGASETYLMYRLRISGEERLFQGLRASDSSFRSNRLDVLARIQERMNLPETSWYLRDIHETLTLLIDLVLPVNEEEFVCFETVLKTLNNTQWNIDEEIDDRSIRIFISCLNLLVQLNSSFTHNPSLRSEVLALCEKIIRRALKVAKRIDSGIDQIRFLTEIHSLAWHFYEPFRTKRWFSDEIENTTRIFRNVFKSMTSNEKLLYACESFRIFRLARLERLGSKRHSDVFVKFASFLLSHIQDNIQSLSDKDIFRIIYCLRGFDISIVPQYFRPFYVSLAVEGLRRFAEANGTNCFAYQWLRGIRFINLGALDESQQRIVVDGIQNALRRIVAPEHHKTVSINRNIFTSIAACMCTIDTSLVEAGPSSNKVRVLFNEFLRLRPTFVDSHTLYAALRALSFVRSVELDKESLKKLEQFFDYLIDCYQKYIQTANVVFDYEPISLLSELASWIPFYEMLRDQQQRLLASLLYIWKSGHRTPVFTVSLYSAFKMSGLIPPIDLEENVLKALAELKRGDDATTRVFQDLLPTLRSTIEKEGEGQWQLYTNANIDGIECDILICKGHEGLSETADGLFLRGSHNVDGLKMALNIELDGFWHMLSAESRLNTMRDFYLRRTYGLRVQRIKLTRDKLGHHEEISRIILEHIQQRQ